MRLVDVADEIAAAVRILSRHRLAAVIVWDPIVAVEGGIVLDARVSRELLVVLFVPEYLNQLHRGAVVVRGDRVERAGVLLSGTDVAERAADVAIAVNEDTGKIRIAERRSLVGVVKSDELEVALRRHALELHRR